MSAATDSILDLYEDDDRITVHGIADFMQHQPVERAWEWLDVHGIEVDRPTRTVRAGDIKEALRNA